MLTGPNSQVFRGDGHSLRRITGFVHQLNLELGQLIIVEVNGIRRSGHRGIEVHKRDHGAISGDVVNRQHGADAASPSKTRITVLFVDLFHQHHAIAQLVEKISVGVCGNDRPLHRQKRDGEIVQYGLQRFKQVARQNALKTLLFTFTDDRRQVGDCWFLDHKFLPEIIPAIRLVRRERM